jgi:hypothetical protein
MNGEHPSWRRGILALGFLCALIAASLSSRSVVLAQGVLLSQLIDELSAPDFGWLRADRMEDSQALRRLSLDLRNTAPTAEEMDLFLGSAPEGRWEQWVDRFSADPLHQERLVDWYDKTLMQRRAFQNVDRPTWLAYLRQTVDAKVPLDEVLRGLVRSTWWNRQERAQQRFYLDRGGDPHAIARDIGRIFFGKDMQCAQCHDHPQIDDYLQIDYHGLLAFVSPSSLVEGKTTDEKGAEQKLQMYAERAPGDAPFESVFNKGVSFRSASRVPGVVESAEPYLAPDQRAVAATPQGAFGGLPNPPVQSRRNLLAEQLQGANRAFAENWANRIWAMAFGRGLVHPLDMHHFDNPASNPALLAALTDALIASNFQMDQVLKQICLSETYRRGRAIPFSSQVDSRGVIQVESAQGVQWRQEIEAKKGMLIAQLQEFEKNQELGEQAMKSAMDVWREAQKSRVAIRGELDAAEGVFNEANKKWTEANGAYEKALAAQNALSQKIQLLTEAAGKLEQAKSLGDDPELATVIQSTLAKAEALKPQLGPLEQATAGALANRDTMAGAKEAERAKCLAVVEKLQPVEQQLRVADEKVVGARREYQEFRKSVTGHQQRIAQMELWLQWFDRSAEILAMEKQSLELALQRGILMEQVAAMTGEKTKSEELVSTMQLAMTEMNQIIMQMDEQLRVVQSQANQLAMTKGSLIESKRLISDAGAIDAAIQAIDGVLSGKQSEMTQKQSDLAVVQSKFTEMQSQSKVAQDALVGVQSKMQLHSDSIAKLQASVQELEVKRGKGVEECVLLRGEFEEDLQSALAIPGERALSPEQLGWSVLSATNVLPSTVSNELAELNKTQPLAAESPAEVQRARQLQGVRLALDKLQSTVDVFSNLYASGVGQTSDDFFASPDQALYVANGGSVYGWSAPNGNNLTQRIVQVSDAQQGARMLTLGLLGRQPNAAELEWFSGQIGGAPETRPAVVHELVWAILAGAEFRLYP